MLRLNFFCLVALSVLMSSAAWGQSANNKQIKEELIHDVATSDVRGIKIISSFYDPEAHTGKVTFRNESSQNIVAFHGQVKAIHANGSVSLQRNIVEDFLLVNAYHLAKAKQFPCAKREQAQRFIHPGENYVQEFGVGWYNKPEDQITTISLAFDLVIYSNNAAETTHDERLQEFVNDRRKQAGEEKDLAQQANDVVVAKVAHPTEVFLQNLRDRQSLYVEHAKTEFEHPSPTDERDKMAEFVDLHKTMAQILEESSVLKVVTQ